MYLYFTSCHSFNTNYVDNHLTKQINKLKIIIFFEKSLITCLLFEAIEIHAIAQQISLLIYQICQSSIYINCSIELNYNSRKKKSAYILCVSNLNLYNTTFYTLLTINYTYRLIVLSFYVVLTLFCEIFKNCYNILLKTIFAIKENSVNVS